MGLKEKRFMEDLEKNVIPSYVEKIKTATGASVKVVVDWKSFETDLAALENVEFQVVDRVLEALRFICRDDVGKKAVQESLKQVSVKNLASDADKKVEFKDGTLDLAHAWGQTYFPESEIRNVLEAGL